MPANDRPLYGPTSSMADGIDIDAEGSVGFADVPNKR
jgi:hypothetical protein